MSQDRSTFTALDSVKHILTELGVPPVHTDQLHLSSASDGPGLPSSFKIGHLAQASIGLTALLAALIHARRNSIPVPIVTVPLDHACIEFKSERLYSFDQYSPPPVWGPIGGLHKTANGYVRVHDNFPHHLDGTKRLLELGLEADRQAVAGRIATWRATELENAAFKAGLVIAALRSYDEWDATPQGQAVNNFPILLRKIGDAPAGFPEGLKKSGMDKCLGGLRVLEFSRVIAAPLAGKTLAVHGADVLWVTSPNLPDTPALDCEFGRGERTIQLDLNAPEDREDLFRLPGSLTARGLGPEELAKRYQRRGIICANMSAYGLDSPWSNRRGYDSLAEHFGDGEPARAAPCQVLDHASGYFLAAGVLAALYKQSTEGGSWQVDVSLAGVMRYLRTLGQYEGSTGPTGFGEMKAVKHSACIAGVEVGWDAMPKPLGSDRKEWLLSN
ncbi:CoA-transferase family III [Aspergillus karnatakaensis]|uniref:CoA-transferase family III n=1 Tax=Aspergillus karnatakaensis TaxID=1810916 RepID=UPI003CCCBA68